MSRQLTERTHYSVPGHVSTEESIVSQSGRQLTGVGSRLTAASATNYQQQTRGPCPGPARLIHHRRPPSEKYTHPAMRRPARSLMSGWVGELVAHFTPNKLRIFTSGCVRIHSPRTALICQRTTHIHVGCRTARRHYT